MMEKTLAEIKTEIKTEIKKDLEKSIGKEFQGLKTYITNSKSDILKTLKTKPKEVVKEIPLKSFELGICKGCGKPLQWELDNKTDMEILARVNINEACYHTGCKPKEDE